MALYANGASILINAKSKEMPYWGNLHESIRWLLYIPVVFGLSFSFSFLFNMLSTFRGDFEGFFLYLQVPLNAGLMATLFVWLALNLAPRAPKLCAWLIFSVWSLLVLISVFRFFAIVFIEENMSLQQNDIIELLQSVGWLFAGIFFMLRWGKNFSSVNDSSI